jgi:predicted nucleic acid-binding protein
LATILDTNVAVYLRDGDPEVMRKVAGLGEGCLISIVTRIELEGGVYREPTEAAVRRARLDVLLGALPVLAFDDAAADAYRFIIASTGYSRRKVVDRMIAAQALAHGAALATFNADDFKDVPGLQLLSW